MSTARLVVAFFALASAAMLPGDTPPAADLAAFDQLKSLAGDWEATVPNGIQKAHFELIADNSRPSQPPERGMPHDMHTMIHMDGSRLMLTHYCAMHNQPRMLFVPGEDLRR